jgi:hypothetical protein
VLSQPTLCQIEGLAIQFFYLSAMCWLSSMSYDIWSTFRQLRTRSVISRYDQWGLVKSINYSTSIDDEKINYHTCVEVKV